MRTSLRRWLLHRREPKLKPLYQRTSWYDFAGRMRRAIAIDIAIELGEVRRSELLALHATRMIPIVDPAAETVAAQSCQFYAEETVAEIDVYATQPIPELVR